MNISSLILYVQWNERERENQWLQTDNQILSLFSSYKIVLYLEYNYKMPISYTLFINIQ